LAAPGVNCPPTSRDPYAELPDVSTVPAYVVRALKATPRAWPAFQRLAPSHRRRYLLWILDAKQQQTRERRLREAIRRIVRGKELGLR
ncbi:MAG: YdeI/OmpD-associated family protein, partial [Vicinamibacterales bacterium]